jgi:hypothetical protein
MVIALPTFMAASLHANPSVLIPVDPSAAIRMHAQLASPRKRLFDIEALRAVAIDSMRFRKSHE